MMSLAGSNAGLLAGCPGGVLAASRRQTEEHFLVSPRGNAGKISSKSVKIPFKIVIYPTPYCHGTTFSTRNPT
jgi:hypothetical protein